MKGFQPVLVSDMLSEPRISVDTAINARGETQVVDGQPGGKGWTPSQQVVAWNLGSVLGLQTQTQ